MNDFDLVGHGRYVCYIHISATSIIIRVSLYNGNALASSEITNQLGISKKCYLAETKAATVILLQTLLCYPAVLLLVRKVGLFLVRSVDIIEVIQEIIELLGMRCLTLHLLTKYL